MVNEEQLLNSSDLIGVDLHTHSYASDGILSPSCLVNLAKSNGATLLALTDHDCLEGLTEAQQMASTIHLPFLNGVEISVTWQDDITLHIIGLDIDSTDSTLLKGLSKIQKGRFERLERIHKAFLREGIAGVYEGALEYALNPKLVGRVHVARYLVKIGLFDNVQSVFEHCLVRGKMGYISHSWATLEEAIGWIVEAKGVAILAHPSRYSLTHQALRQLLEMFYHLGGIGVEVGCFHETHAQTLTYVRYANELGLQVSVGSDFHAQHAYTVGPGLSKRPPPESCLVWERWL